MTIKKQTLKAIKFKVKHRTTVLLNLSKSDPFLSGDFFAKQCDYAIPEKIEHVNIAKLINAKSIFIPSHHFNKILNLYAEKINPKIIICGNSDYEFNSIPKQLPPSLQKIYLQNSFISDNKFVNSLPIGIENLRFGRNGFKSSMRRKRSRNQTLNKILIGPYGPTHNIRSEIYKFYSDSNFWDVISFPVEPSAFPDLHRKYRFTLCPRGNGIDTHRVWESIYRGSWPILEENNWSMSLAEKYPIILVKSFFEPLELQKLINTEKYSEPPVISQELLTKYWRQLLENSSH